jgi:hypothetical protein
MEYGKVAGKYFIHDEEVYLYSVICLIHVGAHARTIKNTLTITNRKGKGAVKRSTLGWHKKSISWRFFSIMRAFDALFQIRSINITLFPLKSVHLHLFASQKCHMSHVTFVKSGITTDTGKSRKAPQPARSTYACCGQIYFHFFH